MTFDYAALAITVTGLLEVFGFETTIRRQTKAAQGVHEPAGTPSTVTVTALRDTFSEKDQAVGPADAKEVLYLTAAATPTLQDEVLLDGSYRKIVFVEPIAPGNVKLLFKVMVDG